MDRKTMLVGAVCALVGTGSVRGGVEFFRGGVNIDFNQATGAGAGQPTILFGGAAGQSGYWNPVNSLAAAVTIRDLGNSFNAVTLTHDSLGGIAPPTVFGVNNANTSGDGELLMDDALDLGATTAGPYIVSMGPLAGGLYRVVVYAGAPDSGAFLTNVGIGSNIGFFTERVVGGAIPAGGVFTEGVTHTSLVVPVWRESGRIRLKFQTQSGFGAVNGVQVVPVNPTRLYVSSVSTGGDGLSWGTALGSVQQALDLCRSMPSVTEVWVRRGTYFADEFPAALGDREAEFEVPLGVSLMGGFVGTEATAEERPAFDGVNNLTVLSGEIGGAGATDNSKGLVRSVAAGAGGTGTMVRLDRLVLTGAYLDIDGGDAPVEKGAVVASIGGVSMRECVVRGNVGWLPSVSIAGAVPSEVVSSVLEGNRTHWSVLSVEGATTVDRCVLRGNVVPGLIFGSVMSVPSGNVAIRNSLISGNNLSNTAGGQMFALGVGSFGTGATVEVQNCTVANNERGGGLYVSNAGGAFCFVTVNNSILWQNRRPSSAGLTVEQQNMWVQGTHTVAVFDTIVEGWSGALGPAANLNIGSDPEFVDPDGADNVPGNGDDDYRVVAFSPARDSGWNTGLTASFVLDLSGNARRVDDPAVANSGFSGGFIDRGCYEMQSGSAACAGDVGQTGGVPGSDGVRDNNDFVVFIDWFFARDGRADRGRQGGERGPDGVFDNNDFVAFIDEFFTPC